MLLPLAALLIAVIITVYGRFDGTHGLDYGGNLDYLRYVDFKAYIPHATDGWQMYHPPAYYIVSALLFEAFHRAGFILSLTDAGRWLATAAWVLEGAVAVAAVRGFRGSWLGASAAAAIVWLLPGQAVVGTMLYNETLTGLGVGLMVLGAALLERWRRWALALLGIGFPLAALSKYSGLAAASIVVLVILWRFRRSLRPALMALAPGGLLVALFYLRNVTRLGTPLPLNSVIFELKAWDPLGWGHPPGFFTRITLAPCAATDSFVGGWWKWFFGLDCFDLAPWSNVLSPPLLAGALLLTLFLLAALGWVAFRGLRDPPRLLLVLVPAVIMVAFIAYVINVPSTTSDKGVYLLAGVVPVAVASGLFLSRLTQRRPVAAASYVLLLAWSAVMAHASGLG